MIKLFTIKGGKINIFGITKAMVSAFIASSLVVGIASYFKISQEDIWKFLILIQRQFGIEFGEDLDKQFRDNEKLLDFVIKNEVDKALYEYERLTGDDGTVRIPSPRYSEKPIDPTLQTGESRLLGGEMRICAPWVDDCPKD